MFSWKKYFILNDTTPFILKSNKWEKWEKIGLVIFYWQVSHLLNFDTTNIVLFDTK